MISLNLTILKKGKISIKQAYCWHDLEWFEGLPGNYKQNHFRESIWNEHVLNVFVTLWSYLD